MIAFFKKHWLIAGLGLTIWLVVGVEELLAFLAAVVIAVHFHK